MSSTPQHSPECIDELKSLVKYVDIGEVSGMLTLSVVESKMLEEVRQFVDNSPSNCFICDLSVTTVQRLTSVVKRFMI